ncbi:hypothetical protein DIPPA_21168 [Diplonema papillatum]|nr:hypothetical protein DIPPA_21168 [Diplonema papillatum]
MSKSTWAYRLPTPLPMKHSLLPFQHKKANPVSPWNSSHMENYEHLKGNVVLQMQRPSDVFSVRHQKLLKMQLEVKAGRPLWALDDLQQMYEAAMLPTLDHYRIVLLGAVEWDERQTALDCWALLERQSVIPDDKTLCCWFEVCKFFGLRDEALRAWNRYCTEFRFLEEGEQDPKPVRRQKHTLKRDDYYNLPWWKKRWEFNPNEDVADQHRYNRTREIYAAASTCMRACGEHQLADDLFKVLAEKLPATPTPVAEPLSDPKSIRTDLTAADDECLDKKQVRYRIPNIYLFTLRRSTRGVDWVPNHEWLIPEHHQGPAHPERSRDVEHGDARFYTNAQYLLYAAEKSLRSVKEDVDEATVQKWLDEVEAALPDEQKQGLNYEDFVIAALEKLASADGVRARRVHEFMHEICEEKQLRPTVAMHAHVFRAIAREAEQAGEGGAGDLPQFLEETYKELRRSRQRIDLSTHTAILTAHVALGTRKAHAHFVDHVLRGFTWGNDQISILLKEYRAVGDAGDNHLQKKLCERMYIWSSRYNVGMNEANKQYIEDDFERIGVQVRTKEELITWKFKRQATLRDGLQPTLPNPVMDRVTHTLKTSDHLSPDHLNEWVVPYSNAGRSFNWKYSHTPHQADSISDVRDLTDLNRVRYIPQQTLLSPWVKSDQWATTKDSFRPERVHEKLNINRWLEDTNKAFPG